MKHNQGMIIQNEINGLWLGTKNRWSRRGYEKYGDFIALHPLNVEVHAGEFFGVFGPNGAGKSTFIKLLTGNSGRARAH